MPGEGPVTTTTVFDEKPAPHNFGVLKQTRVSAWGLVTAEMFAQPHSAASASLTHQAGRASGARVHPQTRTVLFPVTQATLRGSHLLFNAAAG